MKRRASIAAFVLLALSATLAGAAAQPVKITNVDTSRAPLIAISVQAPAALAAKGTPAYTVSENGQPVSGLNVSDPNTGTNIALAVDVSRSMKGKPLDQALAAAQQFTVDKRQKDEFTVLSFGDSVSAASSLTSIRPRSPPASVRSASRATRAPPSTTGCSTACRRSPTRVPAGAC